VATAGTGEAGNRSPGVSGEAATPPPPAKPDPRTAPALPRWTRIRHPLDRRRGQGAPRQRRDQLPSPAHRPAGPSFPPARRSQACFPRDCGLAAAEKRLPAPSSPPRPRSTVRKIRFPRMRSRIENHSIGDRRECITPQASARGLRPSRASPDTGPVPVHDPAPIAPR